MTDNIGIMAQEIEPVVFAARSTEWMVIPQDGRFAVCELSNEFMRFGSDGSVGIGGGPRTVASALQCYWFNTREWAELAKRRLTAIDRIPNDILIKNLKPAKFVLHPSANIGVGMTSNGAPWGYSGSNWTCYMFGSEPGNGFSWNPPAGKVPNFFWRKMQYLMVGNKWVRQ